MPFTDPPEAPEGGGNLKATDLKGKPCVLRPTGFGTWPARNAEHDEQGNVVRKASKESPYVECDAWVFDRAGLLDSSSGVRVSWWRAVAQLEGLVGEFVACRPTEQEDRSIILVPLSGEARQVAERIVKEIEAGQHDVASGVQQSDGSEPF